MATQLTTWDKVRLVFGESAPTIDNAEIIFDFLIAAASRMIRKEVKRRFTQPRVLNVTRTFTVRRGGVVYLDEMMNKSDIISITGPVGAVTDWTYEPDEEDPEDRMGGFLKLKNEPWPYELALIAPEHDDFFTRNMHPPEGAPSSWEDTEITVTGNWGYTKIPDDISFLAARTVQKWWSEDIVNYVPETGEVTEVPERLPQSVISALRLWRKPRMGAAALSGG